MSYSDPLTAYEDDPVGDTVHHPYTAFNQGWDARSACFPLSANPYEADTREHRWWIKGWHDRASRTHTRTLSERQGWRP